MSNLNHKMLYKTSQDIYNEEFVNLINGLNESIKEYYKVSKYNVKETDKFLSIFENEWKLIENSLKEINSSEEINKILVKVNQSESLIGQLQQNSLSNDKNLNLFFEDAKIIFKKMKSKRNENLSNLQRNRVSNSLRNQKPFMVISMTTLRWNMLEDMMRSVLSVQSMVNSGNYHTYI